MNGAEWHLVLNHLPIVGLIFTVLVLGYGVVRKNKSIVDLGYMLLVLCAIFSMAANITGEGAEHWVEEYTSASHDTIHEHEEAAELANMLMLGLGLIALIALIFKKVKEFAYTSVIVLVLSLVVSVAMVNVGNLGGDIIRSEYKTGEDGAAGHGHSEEYEHEEGEHDDD